MNLESDEIAEYLKKNPDFFERHAALLADARLPHPHGGRTISIAERQILALRERARNAEGRLKELIRFGEENDRLAEKIHRLACDLIGSRSLDTALEATYTNLRESFAVPHATIRLWDLRAGSAAGAPEAVPTSQEVRDFVAALPAPYCGRHAVYECDRWFGDAAPHLKSFALVKLANASCFGVLVLASEDAERFYPEMGTLYLARIGELIATAIAANEIE